MVELKCRAEMAVTGRSACRNPECENSKEQGGRIPQGKLRWGIGGPGGHSMKWYCIRPRCLPADQVKDMLVPEKCASASVMDGVQELPDGFREATITCLEAIRDDKADQLDPAVLVKLDEVGPLPPVTPRAPPRELIPPMTSGRKGLRRVSRLSSGGGSSSIGAGASSSPAAEAAAEQLEQEEEEDEDEDETDYNPGRGVMGRGGLGASSSSLSSMPVRTPPALLIPRHTDTEPGSDSPVFPPPEKLQKLEELETGEAASIDMMYGSGIGGMGLGATAAGAGGGGAGATVAEEGLGGSHLATDPSFLFGGASVGHSAAAAAATAEGFGLKPEAGSTGTPSPSGGFPVPRLGTRAVGPAATGLGGFDIIGSSPALASATARNRSDAGAGAGAVPPPGVGLETISSSSSDAMAGYLLGSSGTDAVASALEGIGDIMGAGDLSATAGEPGLYGVPLLRGASAGELTSSRGSSGGGDVMPSAQPAPPPGVATASSPEVAAAVTAAPGQTVGGTGDETRVGLSASGAQASVFPVATPATSEVLAPATSDAVSAEAVDAYAGTFAGGLAGTASAGTPMPRVDPAPPAPSEPSEHRPEGRGSGVEGGDSNVQ